MFWLEAKLVVCCGQKWGNACQDVVFIQLGDDTCKGNRPIVPSITYVPILVFENEYNDCLHGFLRNFPCIKHTLNRLLRWLHTLESALDMCSTKIPSLPAARFSCSLCSRDLILKLLHISSSIPSKLLCEFIF